MNDSEHTTFTTPKGTVLPLRLIRGKPYMDCAYRVVWFREEKPTWKIHTFVVEKTDKHTLVRAAVLDDKNETMATAHKLQKSNFDSMVEKAESQAVGRALALCGYGTAHAHADFDDDSNDPSQLADSPTPPAGWHPPAEPTNPSGYVVGFGKHKGLTLDQMGIEQVTGYMNFLIESSKRDGKPLSNGAQQFVNAATAWLPTAETDVK